jgi:hypothetical protein
MTGIAVWHMLQSQGANFSLYQKKLNEFAPILGQLSNVSQVIWLNQYPTVDFYGNINAHNTDIHLQKIHHYNQAVRRILGLVEPSNDIQYNPVKTHFIARFFVISNETHKIYFNELELQFDDLQRLQTCPDMGFKQSAGRRICSCLFLFPTSPVR